MGLCWGFTGGWGFGGFWKKGGFVWALEVGWGRLGQARRWEAGARGNLGQNGTENKLVSHQVARAGWVWESRGDRWDGVRLYRVWAAPETARRQQGILSRETVQ